MVVKFGEQKAMLPVRGEIVEDADLLSYMASSFLFVQGLRIIAKIIQGRRHFFCLAIRERRGESRARRRVASPAAKNFGNLQSHYLIDATT